MVAIGRDEHLRLVAEAAEGDGMDDPVPVALENVAGPAHIVVRLRIKAPPALFGVAGIRG